MLSDRGIAFDADIFTQLGARLGDRRRDVSLQRGQVATNAAAVAAQVLDRTLAGRPGKEKAALSVLPGTDRFVGNTVVCLHSAARSTLSGSRGRFACSPP